MNKYIKVLIIALLSLVFIFFAIFILPWVIMAVGMNALEYQVSRKDVPPEPIVQYAEFPYTLEYSLNGNIVKVEDTVICEYTGVDSFKERSWSSSQTAIDVMTGQFGDEYIDVSFLLPRAEEYMGDSANVVDEDTVLKIRVYSTIGKVTDYEDMTTKKFSKKYDLELEVINFETAYSIDNTFE